MKISVVQIDIKMFEKEKNLRKILDRLGEAAKAGAEIVIFPECALTGYCLSSRQEGWDLAEEVPGPSSECIASAARRLHCTAVVGMLERAGDRLYNSAVVVGPTSVPGVHRKVHLLCLGIDRYDAPGDKPFRVFAVPQGKIGVNICFDLSFPEAARVLKLKGAELLTVPTNWPITSDSWQHTCKVRASENHMFVAAASRIGEEGSFCFAGHSQIIDCEGRTLAEAGESEETILTAEVDLGRANQNRVIRVPGEYEFDRIAARRPEMYGAITDCKG